MALKKKIGDNNDNLVDKNGQSSNQKKKRELTAYNYFVRSELKIVKQNNPDLHHRDALKRVGENWQKKKLGTSNNN